MFSLYCLADMCRWRLGTPDSDLHIGLWLWRLLLDSWQGGPGSGASFCILLGSIESAILTVWKGREAGPPCWQRCIMSEGVVGVFNLAVCFIWAWSLLAKCLPLFPRVSSTFCLRPLYTGFWHVSVYLSGLLHVDHLHGEQDSQFSFKSPEAGIGTWGGQGNGSPKMSVI